MLREIVARYTSHFFIRPYAEGGTVVLLYYPYAPYEKPPENYAYVNPNYVAYTAFYRLREDIRGALAEFSPAPYKGNLKALFKELNCGVFLRSNLLSIPPYGTRVSLGAILVAGTHAPVDPPKFPDSFCQFCGKCARACPTHALDDGFCAPHCLREKMNTYETEDPAAFRALNGGLLGCERCQTVCPHNAALTPVPVPAPLLEKTEIASLTALAAEGRHAVLPLAEHIGQNYCKPQRLLYFALNAIRRPQEKEIAKPFLTHESACVRAMAEDVIKRFP